MKEPHTGTVKYYTKLLNTYQTRFDATKKRIRQTSVLRITVFLVAVVGLYITSSISWAAFLVTGVIGLSLFIFYVTRHINLYKKKNWLHALVEINKAELLLISGKFPLGGPGIAKPNESHPFAADFDVVGERSLLQMIDRSATLQGKEMLVSRLLNPSVDANEIEIRQRAIQELAEKTNFRQTFQATGYATSFAKNEFNDLVQWVNTKPSGFNSLYYRFLIYLVPLLAMVTVSLVIATIFEFGALLLFLVVPALIMTPNLYRINREHALISSKSKLLKTYSGLFTRVEQEQFRSSLLVSIKEKMISASKETDRLSFISAAFDYRLNLFVGILLNIFFLWDIRQIIRLEKWKKKNKNKIEQWIDELATLDELCSFGGFAFNLGHKVYPTINTKRFLLSAEDVKHPFLPDNSCVGNDCYFGALGEFHIVTGANMAGKSTYLRAIGVNLILAMCGSPVLAKTFEFTPIKLYSGIKTSDSLQDGESYFFAELKRLESIIKKLESGERCFVILDEILRGTNSKDKQTGTRAFLEKLSGLNASGLIATHDLKIGELATLFPDRITNKRFEVEIKDGELYFDYKLKDGLSENLNATFLMKKMGIIS